MGITPLNWTNHVLLLLAALVMVFGEFCWSFPRSWLGVQVDLLPVLAVYTALQFNLLALALLCLGGGLALDSVSANPLGISILPLWLIGFLAWRWRDMILRDQIMAQMAAGGAACLGVTLLSWLCLASFARPPLMPESLPGWGDVPPPIELNFVPLGSHEFAPLGGWFGWWQAWVMTLVGALAAPVIFRVGEMVRRCFSFPAATETSFRKDREIVRGRNR